MFIIFIINFHAQPWLSQDLISAFHRCCCVGHQVVTFSLHCDSLQLIAKWSGWESTPPNLKPWFSSRNSLNAHSKLLLQVCQCVEWSRGQTGVYTVTELSVRTNWTDLQVSDFQPRPLHTEIFNIREWISITSFGMFWLVGCESFTTNVQHTHTPLFSQK